MQEEDIVKSALVGTLDLLPWISLGATILTCLMGLGMWIHSRKVNKVEDELVAHFEKFTSAEAELNAYKRLMDTEGYQWRMATNMIERAKKRAALNADIKDILTTTT